MMEKNLKRRKDALNAAGSNRSSPASAASLASNALTKSADNKSRASSSKSLTSKSVNKSQDDFTSGLDVLNPDLITGYDLRAHLQQIMKFSDDDDDDDDDEYSSSEDDCSIESFDDKDDRDDELRKLALEGPEDGQTRTPLPTGMNNCQSLVPISEEEGEDLDSEEEKELMKEIRNEITNNVRQEMKSELELYKAKMKKLENNADGTSGDGSGNQATGSSNLHADLDNLDPKLKSAIIKMRKLDKILSKRVRREKEVKRERILLERRLRREIEDLHREKKDEYKEVLNNEHKFLALELPPRHNEGVTVPDEFTGEEVFATQLNEDDYPGLQPKGKSRKSHSRRTDSSRTNSERPGSDEEKARGDASSVASGSTEGGKHRHKRKKDFIKRNKELAADASNAIAMTDEEKKRLDDLLQDVEKITDIPLGAELDDSNPFQLAVKPGEGFVPDQDELRSLTSIDSRLKELLPPDDFRSIASSSMSHLPQNKLFTHTEVKHAVDWERRGERALFQNAEQREMNERLSAIDDELAKLKNPEDELETPRIGEDQLQDLIEQCVTSLSMSSMSRMTLNSESRSSFADTESVVSHGIDSTIDNTPRSPRSARQEILDNPPKLDPDVLQKLLSEAYHPLSKQLSTLKEVDDEEEEETTPIPSEVWKLISMEKVDESQSVESIRNSLDTQDSIVSESYNDSYSKTNNGCNNQSARNGFRNLSRNSSASSLASVSELGTGRETREKEPLKLPEIDPSGTLVTQGLNNQRRVGSSGSVRTPVSMVHNSMSDSFVIDTVGNSDSRLELMSLDGEIMSPHPPSREKREDSRLELMSLDGEIMSPHPPSREKREGSGLKSRTVTPVYKSINT